MNASQSLTTKYHSTFRGLLQAELTDRCRKNPNYSLRSFAKFLGIEPSALSQIINNRRPLTEKMKLRLGTALGLSIDELEKIPVYEKDIARNKRSRKYQQQELDSFAIISDWYHYAILELTYLDGFKSDSTWISRRLGITKSECNIAIERLMRLGFLKITTDGKWIDACENGMMTHLKNGVTSEAAKKFQCQILELSKHAVSEVDIKMRSHTSAAFCFDPGDLPLAIERIQEFRRSFAEDFQPKKNPKEVYQIQISFFPLTRN